MKDSSINYNDFGVFDLDSDFLGEEIKRLALECILTQKNADSNARAQYKSEENSLEYVSPATLQSILSRKVDIHGISSEPTISNVICFGASHIHGAVLDKEVTEKRKRVDSLLSDKLFELFQGKNNISIKPSGHFWYPPGAYMGWHTNSRAPGWRIYINYAEDENKSFFRYQDQKTREIITLNDKEWNIRIFKVTQDTPLWHCVYSQTNRFSLGYMLEVTSFKQRLKQKIKKIMG